MKSKEVTLYSVLTMLPGGLVEWLYGTYSTKEKAKKVVNLLKKNKRIGIILTGGIDII
jgi:hypothetical protein